MSEVERGRVDKIRIDLELSRMELLFLLYDLRNMKEEKKLKKLEGALKGIEVVRELLSQVIQEVNK